MIKKKEVKTKKMTINKLAIMMSNSFEKVYETMNNSFEKVYETMNNSFGTLRKDINDVKKDVSSNTKVSNLMLKEISAIHEDNKRFRETVASLNMDGISYNRRIENLTIRVEKLESK